MPALVIVLAFFGVNIALSAFGFIILYMPYAVGFLVSLILCNTNSAIQALIPGHPWMSFVSVLALTEALIAILTHIKQISCSFIIFSCSVFTGLVGAIAFESMNPDSVAYCIFVSVVYLLLTGFALLLNLQDFADANHFRHFLRPVGGNYIRCSDEGNLETLFCQQWKRYKKNCVSSECGVWRTGGCCFALHGILPERKPGR